MISKIIIYNLKTIYLFYIKIWYKILSKDLTNLPLQSTHRPIYRSVSLPRKAKTITKIEKFRESYPRFNFPEYDQR